MREVSFIEVLDYLRPNGGIYAIGEDYEGIEFRECEPFTKEEFLAAFDKVASIKTEKIKGEQAKREAALTKLTALGLTTDDLSALGL